MPGYLEVIPKGKTKFEARGWFPSITEARTEARSLIKSGAAQAAEVFNKDQVSKKYYGSLELRRLARNYVPSSAII